MKTKKSKRIIFSIKQEGKCYSWDIKKKVRKCDQRKVVEIQIQRKKLGLKPSNSITPTLSMPQTEFDLRVKKRKWFPTCAQCNKSSGNKALFRWKSLINENHIVLKEEESYIWVLFFVPICYQPTKILQIKDYN